MSTVTTHVRPVRAVVVAIAALMAVLASSLALAVPAAGQETGGEDAVSTVGLDVELAPSTLYGRDAQVTLRAASTGGDAYNVSFTATLPAGVSYVGGSARVDDRSVDAPRQLAQEDGTTVVVWTNVSDLLSGASAALRFDVRPNTAAYDVGDTFTVAAGAFVNADPRTVPDFDSITGVPSGDVTGQGSDDATTQLVPFDLTKREPNAERELLRGVHEHQTVITLNLQNNLINPTTGIALVDHVPAGLEYLGCGGVDNTTEGVVEYSDTVRLDSIAAPAMSNPCVEPTTVETVVVDPDEDGPLAEDVYTRLEWDQLTLAAAFGADDLAPGASIAIDYVAAVPMRRNVASNIDNPTANLDNNVGSLTADEEPIVGHGRASGLYNGVTPSVADAVEPIVAEDVSIHKTASTGSFAQGSATTWTLLVESSEYAVSTAPIVVTDVIPDGLDFVSANPAPDAGFPADNGDGTLLVRWTLPGFTAPRSRRRRS